MSDVARREGSAAGTNAGALYQATAEPLPEPHGRILTQVFLVFGTEMLFLPVGLMPAAADAMRVQRWLFSRALGDFFVEDRSRLPAIRSLDNQS